ncbi:MAG: glycoside hydrolase family 3 C-terminal domain-containing protein [Fulvivirga sp.]
MMKKHILFFFLITITACQEVENYTDLNGDGAMQPYENMDLSIDERAEDILKRMTVEDKINLSVGIGFNIPGKFESIQPLRVPGAVGGTFSFDSLGIDGLLATDGPAGVRIMPLEGAEPYFCTAFPIASLVSSTWDLDLANTLGSAIGNEVKEYGMDILLAPALNIHRDPLAGRNFEYFSEDPLLSGKITAAMVNGVQSNDVGTSIKHFAANNQETNRNLLDVIVSERALREIYLKGFEIAIKESQPWTVMTAYNQINGKMASQNSELIDKILREEWGFEGLVMTDWFAGDDPIAQMNAGNDLLMPGRPDQRAALQKGVSNGALSEEILNRNAKRILKVLLASPSFNKYKYSNQPDLESHAKLARKVAAEGAVLLKNDGTLPLNNQDINVAAFGIGSYNFIAGGTGSGDVVEAYTISLVQGLENAGITIHETLKNNYESYLKVEKAKYPKEVNVFLPAPVIPEPPLSEQEIKDAASTTDIAFITIGRNSGEFYDRKLDEDFYLSTAEQEMIDTISSIYHEAGKKVVVILNIGNVIETQSWKYKVDAILLPWQGGQEAGNAVADVLTGKVNPSGKLPTTFPVLYEDGPSAKNFPGEELGDPITLMGMIKASPSRVVYEEGIYVGYRFFTTFDKEVSYPFGYGLSYTSFEYSPLTVSVKEGTINVRVSVKNTGAKAGKEVVQIYVSAPGTKLEQPAVELRAFGKTNHLAPGEQQEMAFTIEPKDYASWDTDRSSWVIEPGEYEVKVGSSSEHITSTAKFDLDKEILVEKLSDSLTPTMTINELSNRSAAN